MTFRDTKSRKRGPLETAVSVLFSAALFGGIALSVALFYNIQWGLDALDLSVWQAVTVLLFAFNGGAFVYFSMTGSVKRFRYSIKAFVIFMAGCGLFIGAKAVVTRELVIKYVYFHDREAVFAGAVMVVVFLSIIIAVLLYGGAVFRGEQRPPSKHQR